MGRGKVQAAIGLARTFVTLEHDLLSAHVLSCAFAYNAHYSVAVLLLIFARTMISDVDMCASRSEYPTLNVRQEPAINGDLTAAVLQNPATRGENDGVAERREILPRDPSCFLPSACCRTTCPNLLAAPLVLERSPPPPSSRPPLVAHTSRSLRRLRLHTVPALT